MDKKSTIQRNPIIGLKAEKGKDEGKQPYMQEEKKVQPLEDGGAEQGREGS